MPSTTVKFPFWSIGTFMKKFRFDDVAFGQPVFRKFENEILAAGVLIFCHFAEPHRVAFAGAASGRGVMPPAGIGGDAHVLRINRVRFVSCRRRGWLAGHRPLLYA